MRGISLWIGLVVGLTGWVPEHAQAAPGSFNRTPLLNVEADFRSQAVRTDQHHEGLFITTDGAVDGNHSLQTSTSPWMAARASGRASEAQLQELQEALTAGRIGLRNGRCAIERFHPWSGTYAITWYGAAPRISRLTVEVVTPGNATSPICAEPVAEIVRAIEKFGKNVIGTSLEGLPI